MAMVDCPGCGEKVGKKATFCDFCGADLPEYLPEPEPESQPPLRPSGRRRFLRSLEVQPAQKAVVNIPRALIFVLFLIAAGLLVGSLTAPGHREEAVPERVLPGHVEEDATHYILSFLPLLFYFLHLQRKQMATLNCLLGERKLSFVAWIIWSLFTAGFYALFIEWRMAKIISRVQRDNGVPNHPGLEKTCLGLSILLPVVGTAISILLQQHEINRLYAHAAQAS